MATRINSRFAATCLLGVAAAAATGCIPSFGSKRSFAIPNTYPLGSTVRDHYHQMEMNGEAGDFILYRVHFIYNTAELTTDGKDHLMDIAARMRSAPFPVVVERSENNSDPELDQHRRNIVAQILADFGNPDAAHRVVVGTPYEKPEYGMEAEGDYYRFIGTRGFGQSNFGGGGGGGGGGFGGGGGGFGGGGGGGF